jgi:hypothetical protein
MLRQKERATLRFLPGFRLALFVPFADTQTRFEAARTGTTAIVLRDPAPQYAVPQQAARRSFSFC